MVLESITTGKIFTISDKVTIKNGILTEYANARVNIALHCYNLRQYKIVSNYLVKYIKNGNLYATYLSLNDLKEFYKNNKVVYTQKIV